MVFYTLVLQFYLNNGQKQKRRWYLPEENKIEKKQNVATIMKSEDGKGTVFSMKLKLQGESFE